MEIRGVLQHAPAPIVITRGAEHVCELVNERARALLGGRDVVGVPLRDAVPQLAARQLRVLDGVYRAGRRFSAVEVPIELDWDGDGLRAVRSFDVVLEPLRAADGQVTGVATFAFEVTDQVAARRRVEELAALTRTLTSNASVALFMTDARQRCTFMNPAAERMTGFALTEVLGRSLHELIHHTRADGRPYPRDECPIERALPERAQARGEDVFVHKDGTFYPVAYTASPVVEHGATSGTILEARDITDEQRAQRLIEQNEQALRDADRRKDEFLAMLGHELRNPLAPILTALQLMKLHGGATGTEREREVIERQVRHMVRLVDDLLDISRITRGTLLLKKQRVELARVIAKAVEMASPLFEQRAHNLEVSVPAAGMLVEADPVRLAQVFANLLTNAAKYTEPGGHIAVAAARTEDGAGIEVRVRDSGIGIGPEMLAHMFDLFVQGERTLDRGQGGLGLGLPLVQSLVRLHGGAVSAFSAGPGQGSEFVVSLPAMRATALVADVSGPLELAALAATGTRVLVVDDNLDAAWMLAEALRGLGHSVEVAVDGPEALSLAESFHPHTAILDIGLPVMDGYELARRLRSLAGGDAVRLIALTGYGQETDRARSLQAGFDLHLVKPVDVGTVASAICGPS